MFSKRTMYFLGLIGVAAGIYYLATLDNRTERRLRYRGRRWLNTARSSMSRIGNMYRAGRNMMDERMEMMRH
ncbi:MAG: hypothetical protein GX020_02635 [Firmicutes bacterium]|nr:hypothetical protein [Bacillota bacterium]